MSHLAQDGETWWAVLSGRGDVLGQLCQEEEPRSADLGGRHFSKAVRIDRPGDMQRERWDDDAERWVDDEEKVAARAREEIIARVQDPDRGPKRRLKEAAARAFLAGEVDEPSLLIAREAEARKLSPTEMADLIIERADADAAAYEDAVSFEEAVRAKEKREDAEDQKGKGNARKSN